MLKEENIAVNTALKAALKLVQDKKLIVMQISIGLTSAAAAKPDGAQQTKEQYSQILINNTHVNS